MSGTGSGGTDNGPSSEGYEHEPSSQEALEACVDRETQVEPADDPRLPPEQRAWEEVLRQNLGDFYYPAYLKAKQKGAETAWDYVRDEPGLPRILIIGDSIARGYTLTVRHTLVDKANVHRAPENCGRSENALKKMPVWLGDGHWDLVTFNFGIHDRETPDDAYVQNLEWIIDQLRRTADRLLWVASTPVPDTAPEDQPGSVERLNDIASALMGRHGIPVIDLYQHVRPVLKQYQLPDNCHYIEDGYRHMGQFVAEHIRKQTDKL